MSEASKPEDLDSWRQFKIYSPLLPVLGICIVLAIFIHEGGLLDFGHLCAIAAFICLVGFFLTGTVSSKELKKLRLTTSKNEVAARVRATYPNEMKLEEKKISTANISPSILSDSVSDSISAAYNVLAAKSETPPPSSVDDEKDMTLPEILGTGGIYGIVLGLGIIEALGKYVEKTTGAIAKYFNNTAINQTIGAFTNSTNYTLSIVPIVQSNLPETFRLSGYLFTIIPFIHGTILMFSKKWYLDTALQPHYFVALLYFIVVFIITIMYFFLALNILDTTFFIFSLWLLMAFNSGWLVLYSKIIKWKLKKHYLVRREWVLLNLNTLAFLSVILFAFPNLLSINKIVGNDSWLNFIILVILFGRVLTDYIISWTEFYQPAIKLGK